MNTWDPTRAIAAGRALSGHTQRELAEKLQAVTGQDWNRDKVANLERGTRTFDVTTLIALSKIQGLPYEFYLEGISTSNPGYHDLTPDNPLHALRNSNQPMADVWIDLMSVPA